MSDDETKREDARQEVLIEKAIRAGKIAYCHHCGNQDWVKWIEVYDDENIMIPLCKDCAKDHEVRY